MRDHLLLLCLLLLQSAAGQGLSPGTPAKEYVRFNGQVVAVEVPFAPACSYSLSPGSQNFADSGGSSTVSVSTSSGCIWTATSNDSWISISGGASGQGNGTVSYVVSSNTGIQSRPGSITIGGQTFTVNEAGTGPFSPGLQFVPITPCRLVDTRNANGPFGGPSMAAYTTRSFAVPSGGCGVPATAQAYSLNMAVLPSDATNLTVWPAGEPQAIVTSLNSDGRNKSNAAIVGAGSGGGIDVYSTGDTQLIIDINGYFVPSNGSSLQFYPITPCRVADTRNPNGPLGGPYLGGGTARGFPILSSSCGIPSTAQAYSLNLTALPHTGLIYLTAWAAGYAQPGTSTLNAPTGTATANAAIVGAGTSSEIAVYSSNDTDLLIDVNGYFAPPGSGGLSLYALYQPCRVYDSRVSPGSPFSGTLTVGLSGGACGLPSSAQAYVLNVGAIPSGGPLIFLEIWPYGESQPNYSTLNAADGAITSNMAVAGGGSNSIYAYASSSTYMVLDAFGYFAPPE